MRKRLKIVVTSLLLLCAWGVSGVFAQSGTERPFITKWQGEAGKELVLPIFGTEYKLVIKNAKGEVVKSEEKITREDLKSPYVFIPTANGVYTVEAGSKGVKYMRTMSDDEEVIGDSDKLLSVVQFGSVAWESMEFMFAGAHQMSFAPDIDTPDLSKVTSMRLMFLECQSFNQPLNNWKVDNVTNMMGVFAKCYAFNQPLNNWKVDNVTNMMGMFSGTSFNQPLNNWKVDNVTNMGYMFNGCTTFNQPLDKWKVGKVTDMSMMFRECHAFNQPLNEWDVSNVTDMTYMFRDCRAFNQPLDKWKVGKVTSMHYMFSSCHAFNQPLNEWDVSNVTNMMGMFNGCDSFNQPLNNWNVGNVTTMEDMFNYCHAFNQPLNEWDVSNVTTMNYMFRNCYAFNQPLDKWNVSKVTDMSRMFLGCDSFNQPLNEWKVDNVTDMDNMFNGCSSFNQPLDKWKVDNVTDMDNMFNGCSAFNQPLGSWKIRKIKRAVGGLSTTAMSPSNYSQTLVGWAEQTDITAKPYFFDNVKGLVYNDQGKAARQTLVDKGWNFKDDIYQSSGVSITPRSFPLVFDKEWVLPLEKWGVEETEEISLSTDTEGIISYEMTADKKGVRIKGLKEGKCQLTATIAAQPGVHEQAYTSTCEIEVYIPIERFTITPASKTLKVGEEFTLTAHFFPENATHKGVGWESQPPEIATVDNNGKVTTKKAAECTIIARVKAYGRSFYRTCDLIIEDPSSSGNNGNNGGGNNGGGNSGGNSGNNGGGNGGNNGGDNNGGGNGEGGDNNGGNPTTFTVTLTQPANGKIEIEGHATKSSITVAKDTKLTVKATPNDGYKLKEIQVNGQKLDGITFVVKAATTVTAVFEKETFAVTPSVNNEAWGEIAISGASDLKAVAYGTELTVTVTEKEGYKLKTLTAGDKDITETKKFVVKAATTVTAVFESKQGGAVEDALLAGIAVAPNPFSSQLRLLNPEGIVARYEVVNASGMVVRSGALSEKEVVVDTETLSAGIYFVRLEAQNGAQKSLVVSK